MNAGVASRESAVKARTSAWTKWIAVIGLGALLLAVLIPQYADYTHRSQIAEAVALLGGVKVPLAEYFADRRKWPASLGEAVESSGGKYVQSMAITKGAGGTGEIEVTAVMKTGGVDRRVAGLSVRLISADGGRSWLCRAGTAPEKFLPASCRAAQ